MAQPYQDATFCGDYAVTSGQIALGADGSCVGEGDIRLQTKTALHNLLNALKAGGVEIQNIAMMTVFLQDIDRDFEGFNEAYCEVFGDCKPARMTVQAKLFKPQFLLEMSATAFKTFDNRL